MDSVTRMTDFPAPSRSSTPRSFAPPYARQALMSDDAHGRAQLWRLAASVGLAAALMMLGGILWGFALVFAGAQFDIETGATTAAQMLGLLYFFAFMSLGVVIAAKLLHARGPHSLIGPQALEQGLRAVVWVAPVYLLYMAMPMPEGMELLRSDLPLGTWARLLPFAVLGVFIQVSAEEIAFRGFLQSQLAARFSSRWVWMVLPSLAFGALHYDAAAGAGAYLIVAWAAIFGLIAADLTARSGSLGPAIALHFTHNMGLVYASMQHDLSGLSLYYVPVRLSDVGQILPLMVAELAVILVAWLAARVGLRR